MCARCGERRRTPAPPRPRLTNEEVPAHSIGNNAQVVKNGIGDSSQDVEDAPLLMEGRSGPEREESFWRDPPLFESERHVVYRGDQRLQ